MTNCKCPEILAENVRLKTQVALLSKTVRALDLGCTGISLWSGAPCGECAPCSVRLTLEAERRAENEHNTKRLERHGDVNGSPDGD